LVISGVYDMFGVAERVEVALFSLAIPMLFRSAWKL
jgi:hypothetical protein